MLHIYIWGVSVLGDQCCIKEKVSHVGTIQVKYNTKTRIYAHAL